MKYIITESQLKKITNLVLKEQATQPTTTTGQRPGVVIQDVTYKLPKIKNEQDLNNFLNWNPGGDVVTGLEKLIGKGRSFDYPIKPGDANSIGMKVYNSMDNLLRLHAILNVTKPYLNLDNLLTTWTPSSTSFDTNTLTKINQILTSLREVWLKSSDSKNTSRPTIIKDGEDKKNYLAAYSQILANKTQG